MVGGYKEMPTSVKQIFVTSDFTMMPFIYRMVAFCWCLLVPVDGGLPVLCDFSSANIRLLTLVMTALGQVYHGGELLLFPLGATQIPVPLRPCGNPPLPGLCQNKQQKKGQKHFMFTLDPPLRELPQCCCTCGVSGSGCKVLLQAGPTQP